MGSRRWNFWKRRESSEKAKTRRISLCCNKIKQLDHKNDLNLPLPASCGRPNVESPFQKVRIQGLVLRQPRRNPYRPTVTQGRAGVTRCQTAARRVRLRDA